MPAGRAEVLVFLDVDGVLNADWQGLGFGRSEDLEGLVALEPAMLAALASRVPAPARRGRGGATANRPQQHLAAECGAQGAAASEPARSGGVAQLSGADGRDPRASNCGTTPEGRAEEIGAWLCAERAHREHEVLQDDNGHSSTWRPLFLVLDDLDLMVDSVGKPIFGHIT